MKPNRNSWLDTVNPIRGLSISAAKSIFDSARKNGSALLQKIYSEIEDCDPTLMTCVDRRAAAIAGIGWQVNARASEKDQGLADAQREAVDAFLSGIENFEDALEHLDLAFFRGFSHVQPVWEADNTVRRINLLDSWNFLQEKHTGKWYYNPEASTDLTGCEEITPEARLVTLTHRRPIDWPALIVYIRKALGEQDWGRYVERYGLPNFIATMHAGATDVQRDEYLKTAKAVREGQPAALPNGGSVTTVGTESRGQDPFSLFLEHQEKQIVLMATGGTLTSLAQADTGSLAGGAQMDVWRQIVARDVTVISSAINRALVRPFLEAAYPGKPIAADFKIEAVEKPGKKETADLAVALRNAGYTIDQGELEEAVGFKLEKTEMPSEPVAGGMSLEQMSKFMYPLKASGYAVEETQLEHATGLKLKPTGEEPSLANKEPTAPAKQTGKDLADTLQDALEAAMVEAIAGELRKPELANKDGECEAEVPAECSVHGTPAKKARTIRMAKSSPKADEQARSLGYENTKEMFSKAEDVDAGTVSKIQDGYSGKCKAHEAIAVISENKPFSDAEGNSVKFGNDIIEHYVEGRRRRENEPKVSNLEDLPYAIKAVKSDTYGVTRMKFPKGSVPDPLDPPMGTQREYHINTDRGQMKVFVYIRGGLINGWHVPDK